MGTGSAGLTLQQQLSEFLYAEMAHTFGSYGVACDRLQRLGEELREGKDLGQQPPAVGALETAVGAATTCNANLRRDLHRAADAENGSPSSRRPSPYSGEERKYFPREELLRIIAEFYEDGATALAMHRAHPERGVELGGPPGYVLGRRLAFVQDPQRRGSAAMPARGALLDERIQRAMERLAYVQRLRGKSRRPSPPTSPRPSKARNQRLQALLDGWVASDKTSLLVAILQAMTEAHMAMHYAEHLRALTFGEMITTIPQTHGNSQSLLRYSLALNTFVFAAARAAPWVFAEDEAERDFVLANHADCCEALAPTYCIWIGTQFSLLALHRRAFTWWSIGRHDRAYRDFHKLGRLLRGLRRPAERRGLRVPGTRTFIEGITAMSEHHIGRIYRGQHAHRLALRYFDRARGHLAAWEADGDIGALIKNSHWRLNLLINQGKANYELGRLKRSILSYASAWRAFLQLVESETHATANLEVVEELIRWLEPLVDDPELNRRELRERIEPLVNQFVTLRSPPHLRLAAADIVMRMGHLLFILRLPPAGWDTSQRLASGAVRSDHDLAAKCIGKAAFLDPASTLAAADRLRIEHETASEVETEGEVSPVALKDQWPSGSGRFEEAARITEYTLQRWLEATRSRDGGAGRGQAEEVGVARELIGSFLAHTDSSNVKLAQVYRYLMQEPRDRTRDTADDEFTIDLVCLRRYSSFFPFLPRPSSFRAPGGGYFVQLRESGEKAEPFGIAIDPGPDFIENLYRCGYGLADVHMIAITHDHADHIASLDAMLALMGIREGLEPGRFNDGRRLAIVGNQSVHDRYAFFNEPQYPQRNKRRGDVVKVLTFERIWEITRDPKRRAARIGKEKIHLGPDTLTIEPVKTWGHADAEGHFAQGFLLGFGPPAARSTILFTGDTGLPPLVAVGGAVPDVSVLAAAGAEELREAVDEADIVVAHLSSVPLRELRALADLDRQAAGATDEEYRKHWKQAVAKTRQRGRMGKDEAEGARQTEFLLNQIKFGFRTRAAAGRSELSVSPFSKIEEIKEQSERHLYLTGILRIAEALAQRGSGRGPLLLIGELREELGTFRTRIADSISRHLFAGADPRPSALTTDIGLRVRMSGRAKGGSPPIQVLCTTCDLDNDLIPAERFHAPREIREVCVKGEDEGVFYNCLLHDPRSQDDYLWLEAVERFDPFAD